MNSGAVCDVGRDAAEMPPWSMPTSTSTEPGRMARVKLAGVRTKDGTALLIDESYNANPASMRATSLTAGPITVKSRRLRAPMLP